MTTPKSRKRKTLLSGCLFHIYHDSLADGLAVLLPFWQAAFHLSLAQVGLVAACFESATALFQIPAGFLGERYGERRLLTLGTMVSASCFILLASAGHAYALFILLVVGGLGAGVQHPLAASMISKAYDRDNQRIVLGTYNFSGDMGKFLFPAVAAVVLSYTDWRTLCFGYGTFGLFMALTLYVLLRHNHTGGIHVQTGGQKRKNAGWGINNKPAFSLLSAIGFTDSAVRTALIIFLPFLLIGKGMPMEKTGLALSLLFIGGALGKFLCGILAERIGIFPAITITEAATGLGILFLAVTPMYFVFPFLPLLGIVLNGTSSVLYGTVADFVAPSHVTRAFGLFYTVIISAGAVAPPIFGMLSDAQGLGVTMVVVSLTALTTLPLAYLLRREMTP